MADRMKKHADKNLDPLAIDILDIPLDAPAPAAAPVARPIRAPKAAKGGWWWGVGRRKRATARVRIRPSKEGNGVITICLAGDKTKTVDQYFAETRDRNECLAPLKLTNTVGKMDVFVRVNGGGYMGQAGAIKMGLSRCLSDYDPTVEVALRDAGCLTRDAREVERKKYGQAGARRRFQFSKR